MGLDIHGKTLRQSSVTVKSSTPPTLIASLNPKRTRVTIQNTNTSNAVWLGGSGVTVGTGVRVIGGGDEVKQTLVTKAAVYGIADPADQEVTYLEETE